MLKGIAMRKEEENYKVMPEINSIIGTQWLKLNFRVGLDFPNGQR
jgi:hypothetical protein